MQTNKYNSLQKLQRIQQTIHRMVRCIDTLKDARGQESWKSNKGCSRKGMSRICRIALLLSTQASYSPIDYSPTIISKDYIGRETQPGTPHMHRRAIEELRRGSWRPFEAWEEIIKKGIFANKHKKEMCFSLANDARRVSCLSWDEMCGCLLLWRPSLCGERGEWSISTL